MGDEEVFFWLKCVKGQFYELENFMFIQIIFGIGKEIIFLDSVGKKMFYLYIVKFGEMVYFSLIFFKFYRFF